MNEWMNERIDPLRLNESVKKNEKSEWIIEGISGLNKKKYGWGKECTQEIMFEGLMESRRKVWINRCIMNWSKESLNE